MVFPVGVSVTSVGSLLRRQALLAARSGRLEFNTKSRSFGRVSLLDEVCGG